MGHVLCDKDSLEGLHPGVVVGKQRDVVNGPSNSAQLHVSGASSRAAVRHNPHRAWAGSEEDFVQGDLEWQHCEHADGPMVMFAVVLVATLEAHEVG